MPINTKQLIELIIQPTLKDLNLYSLAAEQLLAGTCAQESGMGTYLAQIPGGIAKGAWQMENETFFDLWENFINFKGNLWVRIAIASGMGDNFPLPDLDGKPGMMIHNLKYACAMARMHYLRVKEPLPAANDIPALAAYWKKYYNTSKGAGTEEQFIANWNKYCSDYYGVHNA